MNTKTPPARRASTAIAAVLALTATPLFAQDAAAPAEAPTDIAAPPPIAQPESITGQDSIVSLPNSAPTPASEPVVSTSPAVSPSAGQPQAATPSPTIVIPETLNAESKPAATPQVETTQTPPPPAAVAPEPAPSPSAQAAVSEPAPAPVASSEATIDEEVSADPAPGMTADGTGLEESLAEAAPLPLPVAADPAPAFEAAPVETGSMDGALETALGLLAALGVGIFGIAALRRSRKKQIRKDAYYQVRPAKPVDAPIEPAPMPASNAHAPIAEETDIREWAQPLPSQRPVTNAASGGLANTGAAVSLPRTMPESFEERDALIRRMVAAKPDRANPFVSRKARFKRARLILQSLNRSFENRKPWIDLSQYPRNWPALAPHNQSAAA